MTAIESRLTGAVSTSPPPEPGADAARIGAGRLDRLMAGGSALARFQPDDARYTVKAGDTLSDIATRHGSDWQTLARINGLADPDKLAVGQTLQLPDRRSAQIHVVRPGETLSGIARDSGVPVRTIADRNGLADVDLIRPGQRLTIGGPKVSTPVPANTPRADTATNAPASGGRPVPDAASVRAADIAAERAAGHASIGKCYAWVKTALQQSGAVPDYMPGVAAKGAGPALEARGFVNLLDRPGNGIRSPYDAPKGAVLVYGAAPGATDRNARYGHIEIRTGSGFASDYASANARTGSAGNGLEGRGRVLIGVYVKPAAGTQAAAPPTGGAPAMGGGRLGNLSMKYETGYAPGQEGAAAAKVSSGIGDPGGKSYGAYQLTSSASSGAQVKKFLANEGAAWATRFDGLDPTKPGAFEQTWKAVAAEQPAAFFKAQHDYIERTHYSPVADRARAAGLDLSTQPQAVRDAVWSMSVQHAGASRIVATALDSLPQGGASGARDIIDAFYDARSAYVKDVAMPAQTRQSLLDRYVAERRDALAMLPN
ncbi:MAG: LysM peptidoglycan-binding domain-containing protein [Sphingomonas phyllosphaerae]|uniref:LysM peptidoglycan-binding domain-containing protein n=1 Tax=Sphingomonas phyllosphaerae TaxID=257003 RepID=UPI002FF4CBF4